MVGFLFSPHSYVFVLPWNNHRRLEAPFSPSQSSLSFEFVRIMSENTTDLSYWLNWRFLVCALFILLDILLAIFLLWRYGCGRRQSSDGREQRCEVLYKDEAWRTCLKVIHPAWLLGFRVLAFLFLLSLIVGNTVTDGGYIFCFYTQWTFSLVTLYFGLASAFSIYGCWQYHNEAFYKVDSGNSDTERGTYMPPQLTQNEGLSVTQKCVDNYQEYHVRPTAGFCGYLFQILYQICAGAVVLTDVVFWLVIFPFMTSIDHKLTFYVISMHSVNFVLVGDTFLNCMRFPMFRFGYFILWTAGYVIFQWVIHACISFWYMKTFLLWPYPFLDLSSSFAPLWYLAVGLLHIPCYGVFALLVKLKHSWLSRSFSDSYQGKEDQLEDSSIFTCSFLVVWQ
ncbi:hypothetical protein V2J09_015443 [Rumex salicifolius]